MRQIETTSYEFAPNECRAPSEPANQQGWLRVAAYAEISFGFLGGRPRFFGGLAFSPFAALCFGGVVRTRFSVAS
jgi:hypothetical protein